MSEKKPYDTTLARIAGNVAAGIVSTWPSADPTTIATSAMSIATTIVMLATEQQRKLEQVEGEARYRASMRRGNQ